MSEFRRGLMMMQPGLRKPVAVRTVDDEIIPVLTLYDYDLPGQAQDEIYEEGGKTWLRKNIVEFSIGEITDASYEYRKYVNLQETIKGIWDYLKEPEGNYTYDANGFYSNAYFHFITSGNVRAFRVGWTENVNIMPDFATIAIRIYGSGVRALSKGDVYNGKELAGLLAYSTIRVAPNINEQIKTYEVEEVIYDKKMNL